MGSLGSPFDAPLPRFHQAAAHLSNSLGATSSKKPPLSELQRSSCSRNSCLLQIFAAVILYRPQPCYKSAPHLRSARDRTAGPSLPESKSLKAYDERQERQTLADFSQSKSLERSSSFTRRRYSRQDLNFSQANSLASVVVSCKACAADSVCTSCRKEAVLMPQGRLRCVCT